MILVRIFSCMLIIALALFKTGHSFPFQHVFNDSDPFLVYDNEGAEYPNNLTLTQQTVPNITLLKYDLNDLGKSYNWTIKADKDIKAEEYAIFKPGKNPDQGVLEVNGSYEYLDTEGNAVQYFYEFNNSIQNGLSNFSMPPAFKTLYELLKIPEKNQQYVVNGYSK